MIIFFGPAGSGKSLQGQILAARHGWRWLSAGQLLRDLRDPALLKQMSAGELLDSTIVNKVVGEALQQAADIDRVIVDGYPRQLSQAKWLVESIPQHKRSIRLVVVLEVPVDELLRRLKLRGRLDDTKAAISERIELFKKETSPIIDFLNEKHIPVVHIDGTGTTGQVHDRIESELALCSLV